MNKAIFYSIIDEELIKTTCRILEKLYISGMRTLVKVQNIDLMNTLDRTLWTFAQKSFVPHATVKDPLPELQPILITDTNENINSSSTLVLIGSDHNDVQSFTQVIVIFSDMNEHYKTIARKQYKEYKTITTDVVLHKQMENGSWTVT
jgi:DNA polymerase-3 subunit chi